MHDGIDSIDGRDGFNGADSWRTISLGYNIRFVTAAASLANELLGQRVRSSTLPEESLIHCWLVHLPWLDSWNTVLRTSTRRHHPGPRCTCLSACRSDGPLEDDSDSFSLRHAHSWFQHVLRAAPALGGGNHPILAHFWLLCIPSYPVDYGRACASIRSVHQIPVSDLCIESIFGLALIKYSDGGGWNSIGLSCLIGLSTPVRGRI